MIRVPLVKVAAPTKSLATVLPGGSPSRSWHGPAWSGWYGRAEDLDAVAGGRFQPATDVGLHLVLRGAAAATPELAAIRDEISLRRAANMRLFAQDLGATSQLRPDLDTDEVADIVWSMNSAEYFMLLVRERGWPPERFATWLADAWCRLFLA